ncbi:hypothetical protein CHARACLAT_029300 [Characodon lateralis]|uniref:Uncharacterized protein n=1 Tax=Characodon lateralis TaxID=208331 RepID=A0ABU7DV77_9TELE|nr:hypothetical protein [Characodon lateralis]
MNQLGMTSQNVTACLYEKHWNANVLRETQTEAQAKMEKGDIRNSLFMGPPSTKSVCSFSFKHTHINTAHRLLTTPFLTEFAFLHPHLRGTLKQKWLNSVRTCLPSFKSSYYLKKKNLR